MRVTDEAARVFAEHAGISLETAAAEIARLLGAMPRRPPRTPPRGRYRYRNQIEGVDFVARIDDSDEELVVVGVVVREFWGRRASRLSHDNMIPCRDHATPCKVDCLEV